MHVQIAKYALDRMLLSQAMPRSFDSGHTFPLSLAAWLSGCLTSLVLVIVLVGFHSQALGQGLTSKEKHSIPSTQPSIR